MTADIVSINARTDDQIVARLLEQRGSQYALGTFGVYWADTGLARASDGIRETYLTLRQAEAALALIAIFAPEATSNYEIRQLIAGQWTKRLPLAQTEKRHLAVVEQYPNHHNTRHRGVRSKTLSTKRLSKREIEVGRALYPESERQLPLTRGECFEGPRPCPLVSCKYHLYLDVTRAGSIKLNFPDLEPWELAETCALDVADRGGVTLDALAELTNITRERVRQLEEVAFAKLAKSGARELYEVPE